MTEEEREEWARRGRAITYWARRTPDALAVTSPSGTRTFAELDRRADQLVRALQRRGAGPGDAVAIMTTNRVEFVEVWAAALRGGIRLTPVNRHFTAVEARYVIDDCGASVFIADEVVREAVEAAPAGVARLATGAPLADFESYDDAIAAEDDAPLADEHDTLGVIMFYTSGTTGRPKGVQRPPLPPDLVNVLFVRPGNAHLVTGPLYHAAPYSFGLPDTLSFGGTAVLMERWDAEDTLRLIEENQITHTHLVPTMFHRLLALPDDVRASYDVSSLRVVVHGAAPCPVPVKQAMIKWFGPVIHEYYAATEGAATAVDSTTWLAKPGTVGKPLDGQAFVGDEHTIPRAAGDIGLVWIKSPEGGFVYHGDPDKTESAHRGDVFTLGDMGFLDEDGHLFLTDRSANLIISGGVNIYPAEVDAVLLTHPAVGDAATVGVPDDEWGEIVVAVVEPRAGFTPDDRLAAELVDCRDTLAHYKCPRRVQFVERLPRSEAGKVPRHLVREHARG